MVYHIPFGTLLYYTANILRQLRVVYLSNLADIQNKEPLYWMCWPIQLDIHCKTMLLLCWLVHLADKLHIDDGLPQQQQRQGCNDQLHMANRESSLLIWHNNHLDKFYTLFLCFLLLFHCICRVHTFCTRHRMIDRVRLYIFRCCIQGRRINLGHQ